eukprot:1160691-Amphidinium_carterae.2
MATASCGVPQGTHGRHLHEESGAVEHTTRRLAFLWLALTEQTLHSLTGQGWERFKIPEHPSDDVLATWPRITVACD